MNKEQNLIKWDDPKSIAEFLQQPAEKIAEFITGLLTSETKDWKLSAGRLVQASIQWKLFSQLGIEMNEYIRKGKINNGFLQDPQNFHSLHELLKFIDESVPDEKRFETIKLLFFKSVFSDTENTDKMLAYQFMQVAKKLDSGDLLVLQAIFDIATGKQSSHIKSINPDEESVGSWLLRISQQIGHDLPSLVGLHEQNLMDLKLITDRRDRDRGSFIRTKYYRLTKFGFEFCKFARKK